MPHTFSRRLVAAVLAGLFLAVMTPAPAQAASLESAKAQGLVGERPDGLLGAVQGSLPPDVAQMMENINRQRLDKYRQIAQQNGTPLSAVQAVAGEKLIQRAEPGTYVWQGGGWTKR